MLAPNVFQTDIVFVERFDFRFEIAAQKPHQEVDFRLRALLPVFLGKGVERQRRNADARGGFNRGTHGGHTGAMSGDARHVPSPGPTPVSVHDDGDMLGKTRPIEPQVNVRFLALHPRRNRVPQSGTLRVETNTRNPVCAMRWELPSNCWWSAGRPRPARRVS